MRPAINPEAREGQMITLAEDCAERQLREGTASSQIIVHYLKLATEREKLERDILKAQRELAEAKTEQLRSQKHTEELISEALRAMKTYTGHEDEDKDESDGDY